MSQSEVICITAYGKFFTGVTPKAVTYMIGETKNELTVRVNIDALLGASLLIIETFIGVPKQLPISQLPTTLVYHTWYQINAKTYEYYLMVRYANFLI